MLSIGAIVGFVFLAIGVAVIVGGVIYKVWSEYSELWVMNLCIGVGAFIILLASIGLFPFGWSYLTLQQHDGTVTKVENRLVTAGGSDSNVHITKEVVFWLQGEDKAYITDDVRYTDLAAGDHVELRRQLEWVYGGQDYWSPTYESVSHAGD